MASDALKRIEEKHKPSPLGTHCYEDDLPWPCDVVKLARALDEASECVLNDQLRRKLKRVLAEVAGGSDD